MKKKFSSDSSDSDNDRHKHTYGYRRVRTTPRVPRLDVPLLSFKQYMDMQSEPIDIHDAEKHYAEYKQIYTNKQNDIFFECHKVSAVSVVEGTLVQ